MTDSAMLALHTQMLTEWGRPSSVPTTVVFDATHALLNNGFVSNTATAITTKDANTPCTRWWCTAGNADTDALDVRGTGTSTVVALADGKTAVRLNAGAYLQATWNQHNLGAYTVYMVFEPLSLPAIGQTAVLWAGHRTPWAIKVTSTQLTVWNSGTLITHNWVANQRTQGVGGSSTP